MRWEVMVASTVGQEELVRWSNVNCGFLVFLELREYCLASRCLWKFALQSYKYNFDLPCHLSFPYVS
jgi:hypothetical protein